MKIIFNNPVYPIDRFALRAFVEILNILLVSKNIAEVNKTLLSKNFHPHYRKLSGYFKWTFENDSFTVWQRIFYDSTQCFPSHILTIHFVWLVCKDRTIYTTSYD